MAEKLDIKANPIQRNLNDVATDLTKIYYESNRADSIEEIQEAYIKFYATALAADRAGKGITIREDFISVVTSLSVENE